MKFLKSRKAIIAALLVLVVLVLVVRDLENEARTSLVQDLEIRSSRIVGARVDIHGADIDREAGEVSVPGLTVANPTGFSGRDMISIDSIGMRADFEARVIEQIKVDGIEVAIEFQGERSNLESVGERVVESAEREDEVPEEGSADQEASDSDDAETIRADWLVERVEFAGIKVSVRADWTDEVREFEFEGLAVEDLNGGTDDLVRRVAVDFLDKVLVSAAEQVEDDRLRERLMEKVGALRQRAVETEG